jgi:hypothetical protein
LHDKSYEGYVSYRIAEKLPRWLKTTNNQLITVTKIILVKNDDFV